MELLWVDISEGLHVSICENKAFDPIQKLYISNIYSTFLVLPDPLIVGSPSLHHNYT